MTLKLIKIFFLGIIAAMLLPAVLFAQTGVPLDSLVIDLSPADSVLVDSILANQARIIANQETILSDVGDEPLEGKTNGLAFSPAWTLLGAAAETFVIAGGISRFNVEKKTETAFPFFFAAGSKGGGGIFFAGAIRHKKFLGRHLNGFYLSGGVALVIISGDGGYSEGAFGPNFGIGYRIFSRSGYYWGAGLSVGAYFITGFDGVLPLPDFELFKFGYAF